MPQAVAALVAAAKTYFTVKVVVGLTIAAAAVALAVDASLRGIRGPNSSLKTDNDLRRESTIRTAVAPRNIVVGKTLVGGVLSYQNVTGDSNKDMWMVVAHAGHEVNDITDMWIYDDFIGSSNISWNSGVIGGKYRIGGTPYVAVYRELGTSTQSVISDLDTAFSDITTAHRGRGNAITALKLTLEEASEKVFEAGEPRAIKALIEGTPNVYDPRLDSSPGNDPTNASYQAYTTNPILLAAWYATNTKVGAGVNTSKIDWQVVADEADYCDVLVPMSFDGGNEARFTCNGMLTTADSHADNIDAILASCNGRRSVRAGKINFRCGRFGVGGNLITNGHFTSNVTGWSVGVNGAVQGITTVIGNIYTVRCTVVESSSPTNSYQLAKSDNSNGSSPTDQSGTLSGHDKSMYLTFTATATTSYICLNSTAAAASTFTWTAGKGWLVDASGNTGAFDSVEAYLVSDIAIDESWLRGDIGLQTATPKSERFNSARGFYVNRDENYTKVEALEVTNTAFVSRDNGEKIYKSFELPTTDHEDEAQRLLHRRIQQTDQQKVMRMPCNYKALKCAVHGFVHVSIDEFGWTKKVFRVVNWKLNDVDGGVDLILKEDGHLGYADPDRADYSVRTASGGVTVATPEVPEPVNPVLTSKEGANLIEWTNPNIMDYWDQIEVFAGATSSFGAATRVQLLRGESWLHKLDNGENRYYWVRARKGAEVSSEVATTPSNTAAANALAAAATTAEWPKIVDDDSYTPTRPLSDIELNIFGLFENFLRENQGLLSGYAGAGRVTGDLFGGADGATQLIDTFNQNIEGVMTVDSVLASDVATAATNFDNRNDRIATTPTAPSVASGGGAVDHTVNTDGSVNISFEWVWGGTESDIDGFIVYIAGRSSSSAYTIGTTPALETATVVPADRRALFFHGVPANQYYTFGVQAYRVVDADVFAGGLIGSGIAQPDAADSENPYLPSGSVAFAGSVTGTVDGTINAAAAFVERPAADYANEAFALSFGAFLRSILGSIGGYPGAERIINDIYGGADGATLLVDALDGSIDGLKYTGGELVNGLKPAQTGATANTGPLLSDSFSLSATLTASATPITTWTQDRDGSTPITLVSGTAFEFDEAGTYLVTINFYFDFRIDNDTVFTSPSWVTFQTYTRYAADGSTYAAATNYQYYSSIKPYNASSGFGTDFGSTSHHIIIDAAENSRLQIYLNGVNTNGFNINDDSRVDIMLLKQVTD